MKRPASSTTAAVAVVTRMRTSNNERPPWPKRKVAIMMGYSGYGYHGMQLNPGVPTIEATLWDALVGEGLVSADNAVDVKKVGWMRSCRTDKGVHAAGQVVSLKMLIKGYTTDSVVDEEDKLEQDALDQITVALNARLPDQIRVFGIRRTVSSFHAKERTDSRYYEYLLPTYVLRPLADPTIYFDGRPKTEEERKEISSKKRAVEEDDAVSEEEETEEKTPNSVSEEEVASIAAYRIDEKSMELLRQFMSEYKGTHSFHNFTLGMSHGEASARRTIYSLTVSDPFVEQGMEWVRIKLHGQSFMLHQIRKMVGLAVMSHRLHLNPRLIVPHCLGPVRVNVPRAPALGLLLDQPLFGAYNKFHSENYPIIDFSEFESEREALKQSHIFPRIFGEESANHPFLAWLRCNDDYAGEFSNFLNRSFLLY